MSHVMCHVSRHMSHVTCHMSHVTFFFFFLGQSGEAYRWRVCYQQGLPCLVLLYAARCLIVRPLGLLGLLGRSRKIKIMIVTPDTRHLTFDM